MFWADLTEKNETCYFIVKTFFLGTKIFGDIGTRKFIIVCRRTTVNHSKMRFCTPIPVFVKRRKLIAKRCRR